MVPLSLLPAGSDVPLEVDDALIDCGASKKGYIHTDYVVRNSLDTIPLPHPIGVYNADGSLNSGGAITHLCRLSVRIGDHLEEIDFHITNTGSSDVILGLGWLRYHNPLVDWTSGKLLFARCPAACGEVFCKWPSNPTASPACDTRPVPLCTSVLDGPDAETARAICDDFDDDVVDSSDDIDAEWFRILSDELACDDDAMLCVDLNATARVTAEDGLDPRIAVYLRQARESTTGVDRYLKEFAPVFSKAEFDHLPPRRTCSQCCPF